MSPEEIIAWLSALFGGGMILVTIVTSVCALAVPAVILGGIGLWIYRRAQQAQTVRQQSLNWQPTTGRVVKSRVEVSSSGDGASVNPYILYEYEVGGRRYEGTQIRAGDQFMRVQRPREAYTTVDRYPAGAIVTIYYNPANPSEAALER